MAVSEGQGLGTASKGEDAGTLNSSHDGGDGNVGWTGAWRRVVSEAAFHLPLPKPSEEEEEYLGRVWKFELERWLVKPVTSSPKVSPPSDDALEMEKGSERTIAERGLGRFKSESRRT